MFSDFKVRAILAVQVIAIFGSCGATLPQKITDNRPIATEQQFDFSQVEFGSLALEGSSNLAAYMEGRGLTHMLLTFGSQNCVACMEKARYLEANLVGQYASLLGEGGSKFEVVGINVDPSALREDVVAQIRREGITHLQWSDPRGQMMLKYFQPAGMTFSVPLSVMISKTSIKWRVASNERLTSQDLIRKVAATLGEDIAGELPPAPPPIPHTDPPIQKLPYLADENPDRLKSVVVKPCNSVDEQKPLNAEDIFEGADIRILQVDLASCTDGSTCAENLGVIMDFLPDCRPESCKSLTLAAKPDLPEGTCSPIVMQGGADILESFQDHFSWNYTPTVNEDGSKTLPKIAGPIVLVFDKLGRLVFSHEGRLGETQLKERWQLDKLTARAKGPSHKIYKDRQMTDSAEWRSRSKWSVVVFYGRSCTSCSEEITSWHRPNHLVDVCQRNPNYCQVLALEAGEDWDNEASSIPSYFDELSSEYPSLGWTLPLGLDPTPLESSEGKRWFNDWVKARFGSGYRSVLFDREGKPRGSWPAIPSPTGPLELLQEIDKQDISVRIVR
jgi:hypothetical protein